MSGEAGRGAVAADLPAELDRASTRSC